jgi:hypothetical protein
VSGFASSLRIEEYQPNYFCFNASATCQNDQAVSSLRFEAGFPKSTKQMKTRIIKTFVSLGLAVVAYSAWAQPAGQTNFNWIAAGDKATWSQGANWQQGYPPPADGNTWQINLGDFSGNSPVPIIKLATDVVVINDATFGPMWGQTLDIYGSYTCGFGMFTWGSMSGPVTTLNVRTNAYLSLKDTLALGTAWWFPAGPHVVMNVYSNAFVGVNFLQFGAKLNLFGGTVSVTNGLNTGGATTPVFAGGLDSDATRAINLTYGGRLVLPSSYTTIVNDWISRGILLVYSVPNNLTDIVIDEADTNWPGRTVVYTTATNARPTAVHLSIPRTALHVGGVEQVTVYADYGSTTNVDVTSSSDVNITYASSPSGVVTVSAGGQVRAVASGNTTVTAIIGSLSNSVAVSVTPYTNAASLQHRYRFSETTGATAADSVGGSTWDGMLNGSATFSGTGQLVLDGSAGSSVQLPTGIITNVDAVTIETWATFGAIPNWACLWAFGDTDGTFGHNYITCQPHTGFATAQTGIKNLTSEQNAFFTPVLDNYTNVHIVAIYHPEAGYCAIYTNGVLAAMNSSIAIMMPDVTSTGDPLNYIGQSLYSADPSMPATIDEFRVYQGPLTFGQIKADAALGADQLIGGSANVSLTAKRVGGNIVISWPTNSALNDLISSSKLGAGAAWTSTTAVPTIVSGNFQVTLPTTAAAQFFRLQK